MTLKLKDGTELTMLDGSYGAAFIFAISDLSEIAEIAGKLTEDNLSVFWVEDAEYHDYLHESGSWTEGVAVFNVRQKSEIEIVKPYVDPHLIPDDKAPEVPSLFDLWTVGVTYVVGDRVRYNNDIYRCLQEHTSQADWAPDATPALWHNIAEPTEEWPEWVQPAGAYDAYAQGAKVSHNDKHWISTVDGNVWEPGAYGWEEQP